MKPSIPPKQIKRRHFIKSLGLTGAGLLSTVATGCALPKNQKLTDTASACTFLERTEDFVYLNSGTEGMMTDCVMETLFGAYKKWSASPTNAYEIDPVLGKKQYHNRLEVATYFGVNRSNICLTDNTTMGLNMALMGLNFSPKDKVVMTNHEHSALKSPLLFWKSRIGLQVVIRPFPPPDILSKISVSELFDYLFPNTSALRNATALCVSHVYPMTGVRLSLKRLRERVDKLNIKYLIVDGAQGFGVLDVNSDQESITYCDFYACPGHKWLNGPPNTGLLYIKNEDIRPPEFFPTMSQRMTKFSSFFDKNLPDFKMTDALQIRGCVNTPGYTAMVKALKFVLDQGGMPVIMQHIAHLSSRIRLFLLTHAPDSVVTPHTDEALLSGMTVFFPFSWDHPQSIFTDKKTCDHVVKKLLEKKIQIRSIHVPSPVKEKIYALRVSTAYFNTVQDIDIFKENLKMVLKQLG